MKAIMGTSIKILFFLLMLTVAVGCNSDSSNSSSSNDTETEAGDTTDETDATNDGDTTDYAIVDTGQTACYDESDELFNCPASGQTFYGQDAQFNGNQPSYTDNGDGTVTDNVTGLMWQQSPDTDGDGDIDASDKLTYEEAVAGASEQTTGGYNDWRLPTIKELYSLIDFSGVDPSGYEGSDTSGLVPFIDTDYFEITELESGTTNYTQDYGYFWTSTSAYFGTDSPEYYYAWYVAFGTAVDDAGDDSHGAGAVRFDTKYEGGALGEGGERYYNYVRLVRDAEL